MAPGCTANDFTPRAFGRIANSAFAVFAWPYAAQQSSGLRSKFQSSKSTGARRWPSDDSDTMRGASAFFRAGHSRTVSS